MSPVFPPSQVPHRAETPTLPSECLSRALMSGPGSWSPSRITSVRCPGSLPTSSAMAFQAPPFLQDTGFLVETWLLPFPLMVVSIQTVTWNPSPFSLAHARSLLEMGKKW